MRDFKMKLYQPVPVAKVMRDFRFFTVPDDDGIIIGISAIHSERRLMEFDPKLSSAGIT